MSDKWRSMSAADLGRGIGAGEIDPVELTEVFLAAIEANPLSDRVYVLTTPARARAEAAAASERAKNGCRLHPLDGVPISWKDLYDAVGEPTRAGTALLDGEPAAEADALCLARASAAGLVCLGKTHMTEIAFSGLGVNPVTATSPNPNGEDWAPGGSSSGAAASVTQGLAAAGIGSDTGGSVRIPSAWQNIVGLKTTLGLIPVDGSKALAAGFDTVGPLCRTVEDAALLTSVMAATPAPDLSGASLEGMRFLADTGVMLSDGDAEPIAAYEAALEKLEAAGAEIVRQEVPEYSQALSCAAPLIVAEAWAEWGERIERDGDKMFFQVRDRTAPGRDVSAATYLRAWEQLTRIRASWNARARGFDAAVAPTAAILPPSVSRLLADEEYYKRINLVALRNTRIGNLMGLSALTLPTGTPSCGVMLMGKPGGEEALLRLGAAAEAALG